MVPGTIGAGALKLPVKCHRRGTEAGESLWYLLNYVCKDGEWTYAEMVPRVMLITNPDDTTSLIKQEKVTESKKTLDIHDSPSGGNTTHLSFIKAKVSTWVNRMTDGHLPNHMAWIAYKHQLWPGVRYGLGTMTKQL